jgi:HEPN domain-containing protein
MERYESWIDRAKSSLEMAKTRVSNLVYYEDLCYQAQQAAEKGIKGLLIYYNVEPQFTHNLGLLLNELEEKTEIPENVKEITKLTKYAVQTRYPGEYDDITKENYEEGIKIAAMFLEWVQNKISENIEIKNKDNSQ